MDKMDNKQSQAFDLLEDVRDKLKQVAHLAQNVCIVQDAEALATLTLSLQEKVATDWQY